MLGSSGGVHFGSNEKRRNFDRAFKVEAVWLITEERRKVGQVARELGLRVIWNANGGVTLRKF
ncbi:MAG: transposase [Candidatus Zixiibacteriota bacterium]|nr:MAG: transposase [candidate division Zixibacteria bacterium]